MFTADQDQVLGSESSGDLQTHFVELKQNTGQALESLDLRWSEFSDEFEDNSGI